jgi:hypothetical protein
MPEDMGFDAGAAAQGARATSCPARGARCEPELTGNGNVKTKHSLAHAPGYWRSSRGGGIESRARIDDPVAESEAFRAARRARA